MVSPAEIRETIREQFRTALSHHDKWDSLSKDQQITLVRRLERSCMNKTVDDCKKEFIDRLWTNAKFIQRYSGECARMLRNLDIDCSSGDAYLGTMLINGKLDPKFICELDNYQLNPEASQEIRDNIELRMKEQVAKKYSSKYTCGRCKSNKVEIREVQTRSADELSSFRLRCVICNNSWLKG